MKAFGLYWFMGCLALLFSIDTFAQPFNGDYRSVATGNWSSVSTWQRYNGSAWVAATDYPANPSEPDGSQYDVTLQSPFTVTLDTSPKLIQVNKLIVDFGATLVDAPTALSYNLSTQNGININGTVNLTNTTVLTSKISSYFTIVISSTGVLSAHVVESNNTMRNFGTATVTQNILGFLWVNFGTLNFGGASMTAPLQADVSNNTVNYYSASTNQTVRAVPTYYRNLTLSGTGGRTKTLSANTTVSGNLSIQGNSSFSLGGFDLSLGGNWNNSSTSTSVVPTTSGTFIFNGTSQQSIINTGHFSGTYFRNLTIANTASSIPQINVTTSSVVVFNSLTMTSGVINLNGNILQIGADYTNPVTITHSGASGSGWFYNGILRRLFITNSAISAGSISGLIPVGTSTHFRPLYISTVTPPSTTTTMLITAPGASSFVDVSLTDGASTIRRQNRSGWTFSSVGNGTYNLRAGGTGLGVIGNVADLRLTPATSVLGTAGTNSGTTSNPLVERTGLTLANLNTTFYVGSVNLTSSPLPVELSSFTGEAEGTVVNLHWVTKSELNSDHFSVSRSINGVDFMLVGSLKGAGKTNAVSVYNLQDINPIHGTNYYRLEQTDLDGTHSILSIISVDVNGSDAIQIYPNPVEGGQVANVQLHGMMPNSNQTITVVDHLGRQLLSFIIRTDESGRFIEQLKLPSLSSGIYWLRVNGITKRLLVR